MPCNFYVSHKAIAEDATSVLLGPLRVQEGKALRVFVLAKAASALPVTVSCKIGGAELDFRHNLGGVQLDSSNLFLPAIPQSITATPTVVLQEVVFPELDRPATWVELSATSGTPLQILGIFLVASGR
jgi:hypothetical protein